MSKLRLSLSVCGLLIATMAGADEPHFSKNRIDTANTTVDLIPSYSGTGYLNDVKCNFPATSPTPVRILAEIDGSSSSFVIDPSNLQRESSGAGKYLTGWIPFQIHIETALQLQLDNTGLGTSTIDCWATWVATDE